MPQSAPPSEAPQPPMGEPRTAAPPLPTPQMHALMHELRTALHALTSRGAESVIDIGALALDEKELAWLRSLLGSGEVTADLVATGRTAVTETALAGVWWVKHTDKEGRDLATFLEIARVPELLTAQWEDVRESGAELDRRLNALPTPAMPA